MRVRQALKAAFVVAVLVGVGWLGVSRTREDASDESRGPAARRPALDVAQAWAEALPAIARARTLVAEASRPEALAVLDAAIAAEQRTDDRANLVRWRLRAEREIMADEAPTIRWQLTAMEDVPYFVDARSGASTVRSLTWEAAVDALLHEVPDHLVGPPGPAHDHAVWYLGSFAGEGNAGVEDVASALQEQGLSRAEAVVATVKSFVPRLQFDEEPPALVARLAGDDVPALCDGLAALAGDTRLPAPERRIAACVLRELADLPMNLGRDWDLRWIQDAHLDPDAAVAAWREVRALPPDDGFRVRLAQGVRRLHVSLDALPAVDVSPYSPSMAETVRWLTHHVGSDWYGERIDFAAVARLHAWEREVRGGDVVEWLARRAGVDAGAPVHELVAAMFERPEDRGVLHHLLVLRGGFPTAPPIWCTTDDGGRIALRWRAELALPPERRTVGIAWLQLTADGWVARARRVKTLNEGQEAWLQLEVPPSTSDLARREHPAPGEPIHRRVALPDELRGTVALHRTEYGLWASLDGARFIGRSGRGREVHDFGGASSPALLIPPEAALAADVAVVLWMDDADRAGESDWRALAVSGLRRVSEQGTRGVMRRDSERRRLLGLTSHVALPDALPALRELALSHGDGDALDPALLRAMILAGDERLLVEPTSTDLASGSRLAHLATALDDAGPLFWLQLMARSSDPRVRGRALTRLDGVDPQGGVARVLVQLGDAHPEIVPSSLRREAWKEGADADSVAALIGARPATVAASVFSLLLGVGLLLHAARVSRRGGEAPRAALWALVLGLVHVVTRVGAGPVDLLPDALGNALAAGAVWRLARIARSRAGVAGTVAFGVAAVASLAADLAVDNPVLDTIAAGACALGVVSLAPLAAHLVRELVPRGEEAPRKAARAGGFLLYATAVAGALLSGGVATAFLDEFLGRSIGEAMGLLLRVATMSLPVYGAICVALASRLMWRIGLRRGRDATALPVLFVVGYLAPVVWLHATTLAHEPGARLHSEAFDRAAPLIWIWAALAWCLLRLLDAVTIRRRAVVTLAS